VGFFFFFPLSGDGGGGGGSITEPRRCNDSRVMSLKILKINKEKSRTSRSLAHREPTIFFFFF
jgi:hypothetical protein